MRFYDWLLRGYPASFRNEYGPEMRSLFARRRLEATGPLSGAALCISTIAEVTGNAALVHLDILRQDIGYSWRMVRRAPGFAITAVVIVALGIGATTAAFSVTDFVLLRPLPFPEPDRLVKFTNARLAIRASSCRPRTTATGSREARCSRAWGCITTRPPTSSARANRCA